MLNKFFLRRLKVADVISPIILFAITFYVALDSPFNIFSNGVLGADSGVFRYVAFEMHNGGMPYLDTFDHKGPLIYLINYVGMEMHYLKGVWIIEFILLFTTFFGFYKIARLRCKKIYAISIVVIVSVPLLNYFEGGNLVEEYALPFITWSLYYYLRVLDGEQIHYYYIGLTGIFFGAVLLLRLNMIAIWVVFPFAIILYLLKLGEYRRIFSYVLSFFGGLALFLLPIFLWLNFNNAFRAFVDDYLFFNFAYSSIGDVAAVNAGRMSALFTFGQAPYFMAALLFATVSTIRNKTTIDAICLLALLLSLASVCVSGRTYGHYGMVIVPAAIFSLAGIAQVLDNIQVSVKVDNRIFIICFIALVVLAPIAGSLRTQFVEFEKFPKSSTAIEPVISCIKENTSQADCISVYGNWDIVYVLSHRLSASRYSYQTAINAYDQKMLGEYYADLSKSMPKVIVVEARFNEDERINDFLSHNNYKLLFESVEQYAQCKIYKTG